MTVKVMTSRERLALVNKPYLRVHEIRDLLSIPYSTVRTQLIKSELKKYGGFGYLTDDVIEEFRLQGVIKRWRADK